MGKNELYGRRLARRIVERVDALGLKGKRAENEAMAYWVGATALAEELNEDGLRNYLATLALLLLATRGMAWVREFAADTTKEGEEAA